MNHINFLVSGSGVFEGYKRSMYLNDSAITKLKDIDTFTGTITHVNHEGDVKSVYIDGAYAFAVISDSTRAKCSSRWEKQESNCLTTFVLSGMVGTAGLIAALTGSIIFPIAVGAISAALLGIAILAKIRGSEANKELKLWEDPVNEYIEKCRRHHMTSKMQKKVDETENFVAESKKKNLNEFKAKIYENFIKKLREIDPEKVRTSEFHKGFLDMIISSLKGFIELNMSLGSVTKSEANEILSAYFAEFPDLKSIAFT